MSGRVVGKLDLLERNCKEGSPSFADNLLYFLVTVSPVPMELQAFPCGFLSLADVPDYGTFINKSVNHTLVPCRGFDALYRFQPFFPPLLMLREEDLVGLECLFLVILPCLLGLRVSVFCTETSQEHVFFDFGL